MCRYVIVKQKMTRTQIIGVHIYAYVSFYVVITLKFIYVLMKFITLLFIHKISASLATDMNFSSHYAKAKGIYDSSTFNTRTCSPERLLVLRNKDHRS